MSRGGYCTCYPERPAMDCGVEEHREAAARGIITEIAAGAPAVIAVEPHVGSADAIVDRVRSLLRTWEKFGGGGEDNMIAELRETLGPEPSNLRKTPTAPSYTPNPFPIPPYVAGP